MYHQFLLALIVLSHTCFCNFQCSEHTTLSGLSSGGFFSVQLHMSYSKAISGSAIFAGGTNWCSKGDFITALTTCLHHPGGVNLEELDNKIEELRKQKLIDDPFSSDIRMFIMTGTNDHVVIPEKSKLLAEQMKKYTNNIKPVFDIYCGHAIPTDDYGWEPPLSIAPFISNCGYKGAYEALNYLYDENVEESNEGFKYHNIFAFNQSKYISNPKCIAEKGFVYVPSGCQGHYKRCPLSVFFHGCFMTYDHVQLETMTKSHYLELAEKNNIIMLFPFSVIRKDPDVFNPLGCWDFWGYCDDDDTKYVTKEGVINKAIMGIIKDFQRGKLDLAIASEEISMFVKCPNRPFYYKPELPIFPF